jgi:pilus assembly protein Flp/PilA
MDLMLQKYLELQNSLKREEGQTLTEYALLLALIAIVVIIAVAALGTRVNEIFVAIKNALVAPVP